LETPSLEPLYLSTLLAQKVISADGVCLGRARDLFVDLDLPQPEVVKLVYRGAWSRRLWVAPWKDVDALLPSGIKLKADASQPTPLSEVSPQPSEILLQDFLLDKQIVDVAGAKVERVNDLVFVKSNGKLTLVQMDVGLRGLLRRLGFEDALVRF